MKIISWDRIRFAVISSPTQTRVLFTASFLLSSFYFSWLPSKESVLWRSVLQLHYRVLTCFPIQVKELSFTKILYFVFLVTEDLHIWLCLFTICRVSTTKDFLPYLQRKVQSTKIYMIRVQCLIYLMKPIYLLHVWKQYQWVYFSIYIDLSILTYIYIYRYIIYIYIYISIS